MKTYLSLKKPLQKCESILVSLLSYLFSVPADFLLKSTETMSPIVKKHWQILKESKQVKFMLALVVRVDVFHAHLRSIRLKAFIRVLSGVFLIGVVAPLAETIYTLFDYNDQVPAEVWYYQSMYWLFLCLGPYIDKIITFAGLYFILVHEPNKLKTYILAYPIGLAIAKILWLVQVDSDLDFHAVAPWQYLVAGLLLAIVLIFTIEYFVWYDNHRVRAVKARKAGIQNIAYHIPAEQFREKALETLKYEERVQRLNA
jgi:hypothetical protein